MSTTVGSACHHNTMSTIDNTSWSSYVAAIALLRPALPDRTSTLGRGFASGAGQRLDARRERRTSIARGLAAGRGIYEAAAGLHLDPASPRPRREPDIHQLRGVGVDRRLPGRVHPYGQIGRA